jgi:hypothetical protein
VWDRFRGNVDEPTFRALKAATVTVGFTCPSQPKLVIDYLELGTDPDYWKGLPWTYSGKDPAEIRNTFSRACIHGLSYCSDPRARSILLGLLNKPYGQSRQVTIRSALKTQESVAAQGLYEYKRTEGQK